MEVEDATYAYRTHELCIIHREPLAYLGSKQPSSLTLLANGASTIVGNAVVQMLSL